MSEMSVSQAAGELRLSRHTVLRLIRAGQLRAYRKNLGVKRSTYVVDGASVQEYDTKRRAA